MSAATAGRSGPSRPPADAVSQADPARPGDRGRPTLHFTADRGWINDPYGLLWDGARYHLFHQALPDSLTWRPDCRWGHAVSADLLRWEQLPPALEPSDGDGGCWSGSSVLADDGRPVLFYTSVDEEDYAIGRVRCALPADDRWERWRKGPVVCEAPPELDLAVFRDPFVYRDGADWRMIVGAGTRAGEGLAVEWSSADLRSWRYLGVAARRSSALHDPLWSGSLWECPQVVRRGGKRLLMASAWHEDVLHYAFAGQLPAAGTTPTNLHRITYGPCYYAPTTFRDNEGRDCVLFWLRDVAGDGWRGAESLPWVLTGQDRLGFAPHPAINDHRIGAAGTDRQIPGPLDFEWQAPAPGAVLEIDSDSGPLCELRLETDALAAHLPGSDGPTHLPWQGQDIYGVIDAGCVELCVGTALLALPLPPHSTTRLRSARPHGTAGAGVVRVSRLE